MQNTTPNKTTNQPNNKEGSASKDQNKDNIKKEATPHHGQNHNQRGFGGRGRGGRGGRGGGGRGGGGQMGGQNRGPGGKGGGQHQGQQQFGGHGGGGGGGGHGSNYDTVFLPVNEGPKEQKKFTGRCRLFVGNITPDTTEEEFKDLFKPYGEINECFVNGAKGFGFIRLDFRHNAEAAKSALDGQERKGRHLRVRFANHGAAIKVKNLSISVTNELLEQSFSQFGEIERAIVIADERGRSIGEGLVEFARKPGAQAALKRCTDGVLLLTAYPRPVMVEPVDVRDEEDGVSERYLPRHDSMRMDREKEPRFAPIGSFEYRFAMKYREVDEMEKQQMERVKKEMDEMRVKLESEIEGAMYEYQAEQIRADLMRQQEELRRIEEMRNEQMRRRQEFDSRRDEENRMIREEEERRREMLMRGDMGMRGPGGPRNQMEQRDGRGRGAGGPPPIPPPPVPPMGMGGMNQEENIAGGEAGGLGARYGAGQGDMEETGHVAVDEGAERAQMQARFQGGRGGFGGNGGGFDRSMGMGGGMQGQGGMGGGYGGRPGMGRGGMGMDRRREGATQEDFGEMKRMRRY